MGRERERGGKRKKTRNEEKATNKQFANGLNGQYISSTVNTLVRSRKSIAMTMRLVRETKIVAIFYGIVRVEIEKPNRIYVHCHKINMTRNHILLAFIWIRKTQIHTNNPTCNFE